MLVLSPAQSWFLQETQEERAMTQHWEQTTQHSAESSPMPLWDSSTVGNTAWLPPSCQTIPIHSSIPPVLPQGCWRATNTTWETPTILHPSHVEKSSIVSRSLKHQQWQAGKNIWNGSTAAIHHLLHPEPTWCCPPQETFPCPLPLSGGWCLELDVHSLSQFWHSRGSEPQSRVGTAEAAFTTKAFLVKLTTVCSEHTDKLGRKWEICPRNTAATSSLSTVTRQAPALQENPLPFSRKLQQFLHPLKIQKVKCHKIHVLEGLDKGQVHHMHSVLPAKVGALSYLWQYPQSPFCTLLKLCCSTRRSQSIICISSMVWGRSEWQVFYMWITEQAIEWSFIYWVVKHNE